MIDENPGFNIVDITGKMRVDMQNIVKRLLGIYLENLMCISNKCHLH